MESSPLIVGPDCVYKTEADFKQTVKDRLGIELGTIAPNSGMRAIAKLSKLTLGKVWSTRQHEANKIRRRAL